MNSMFNRKFPPGLRETGLETHGFCFLRYSPDYSFRSTILLVSVWNTLEDSIPLSLSIFSNALDLYSPSVLDIHCIIVDLKQFLINSMNWNVAVSAASLVRKFTVQAFEL